MVIHSNQPELLRQLLVSWYKAHPLDPLEDEHIVVQSNGIAQWLKLALAATPGHSGDGGFGIAASLDLALPSRFVWELYREVLGPAAVPETSPFDKPLLLWRLIRLLPDLIKEPGYEPLKRFLENDSDLRKRYQLAEKIADLFDQYQVYRADWLDAWANEQNVLLNLRGDVLPLDPEQQWQAKLWKALLNDVGDQGHTSRASVHQRFLDAIRTMDSRPAGLPRRVSVFGLSSLPQQSLDVLLAISRFTQVLLCVHNPCEHYWADLLSAKDLARQYSGRHARKAGAPLHISEEDLHAHANPLLAAWGKQGRDYIALLDGLDEPEQYRAAIEAAGQRIDLFRSNLEGKEIPSLLNALQDDILYLRSAVDVRQTPWPAIDVRKDQSIRFHVAHSAQREVEILHDQLLAAFDADTLLRPRDIIVMVPDINAYAPHIEAVFGQIDKNDSRFIPFSISDQTRRHQAPIAFALEFLLGVTESRLAVSDVLDLLDVAAVRQRLGITTEDLPQLHDWIRQTNIRWGLDSRHRQQFMPHTYEQNTWLHGMKRMLLGYAVGATPATQEGAWHDIEPFAEVSGLDAALVGPLARLLMLLENVMETFAVPATPAIWFERLEKLIRDFFECDAPEDTQMLRRLLTSLESWLNACQAAQLDEAIPLAVIRDHWLGQIDQPSLSQRFMVGRVTFATLMPMRAIPFKRVCLLGMNDGEFPRSRPPVDFDLMAKDLRPGDRSRRDDDRYLFLEAILSAREHLHISWIGKSIQDNSDQPPSVLVSQLRDHIATCWRLDNASDNTKLLDAITVEHKLQPFSREYFQSTGKTSPLFTYAREWEHRPVPAAQKKDGASPSLPLPVFDNPITLGQLATFLKDPVKTFAQTRLKVFLEGEDLTSEDHEPFSIEALGQWSLQNELIEARLDAYLSRIDLDESEAVQRQLAAIRRRGDLPMGKIADLFSEELVAPLDRMFEDYGRTMAAWPTSLEDIAFSYEFLDGPQRASVQGRIGQRFGAGDAWCRIELNSSDLIKDRKYRLDKLLHAWVVHLACHVSGSAVTTHVVGKNGTATIKPLELEDAKRHFNALVSAYIQGMCAPLPLAPKTGFAWIERQGAPFKGALSDCPMSDAIRSARGAYEDGYNKKGECSYSEYLTRFFPSFESFWSEGEFSQLCATLYSPLRACVGKSEDSQ